jgi:hypothetical protein
LRLKKRSTAEWKINQTRSSPTPLEMLLTLFSDLPFPYL